MQKIVTQRLHLAQEQNLQQLGAPRYTTTFIIEMVRPVSLAHSRLRIAKPLLMKMNRETLLILSVVVDQLSLLKDDRQVLLYVGNFKVETHILEISCGMSSLSGKSFKKNRDMLQSSMNSSCVSKLSERQRNVFDKSNLMSYKDKELHVCKWNKKTNKGLLILEKP